MFMAIQSKCSFSAMAKQSLIFRRCSYSSWCSFAADMTIKADDSIGSPHYDVKVVADQYYGAANLLPDVFD